MYENNWNLGYTLIGLGYFLAVFITLQVLYQLGKRKDLQLNETPYERLSDHVGRFPVVIITPDDNILINGGSEERRRLLVPEHGRPQEDGGHAALLAPDSGYIRGSDHYFEQIGAVGQEGRAPIHRADEGPHLSHRHRQPRHIVKPQPPVSARRKDPPHRLRPQPRHAQQLFARPTASP